jgi:hypothetical protein
MEVRNVAIFALCAYVALLLLLVFASWHRKRLLRWCKAELAYLQKEYDDILLQRKLLVQRTTWDKFRAEPGNYLLAKMFDARCDEYNARRLRLIKTTELPPKLLPW